MIHYHGTPFGGTRQDVANFLIGRHAFIPFVRAEDILCAADAAQSFAIDNGAFTAWKQNKTVDFEAYCRWVRNSWSRHPGFDWAVIPDVIDGDEQANDALLCEWPRNVRGVPVWHLHESIERLQRLCSEWSTVALGSSGQWATPGTDAWWGRMADAMDAICDRDGRPPCRLHGLRMLNPEIFMRLPLSSADSTNCARNADMMARYGMYSPPTRAQRAAVIAARIEACNSAPYWKRMPRQADLFELSWTD